MLRMGNNNNKTGMNDDISEITETTVSKVIDLSKPPEMPVSPMSATTGIDTFEDSPSSPTHKSKSESKSKNDTTDDAIQPTLLENIGHMIQLWTLTHNNPHSFLSMLLFPIIWVFQLYQGVKANKAVYLYRKYKVFGENFCCAGGLWISSFEEVRRNLVDLPQARTYKLAPSNLDKNHLPHGNLTGDGRLTFLLALSQKGAGGDGSYEGFRQAIEDYITNSSATMERLSDEVTQGLLDQVVQEYKLMGHTKKFFTNNDAALLDFLLKYLHYVLFGLDPEDQDVMGTLNRLHYDSKSAAYYLQTFGDLLQCVKFRNWPKQMETVARIYENSPAIQAFPENEPKYNNLTRYELANMSLAIMSLAGMVGPQTLANIVLGNLKLPDYVGKSTSSIDVLNIWDTLNLSDREEVTKYMYECARLRHPVSNTHKVATQDFTATVRGVERTFPKGTLIYIPMQLAGLDEDMWGPTAFDFNQDRENLCPFSMIFHSVGEQTNGRICPGKKVAETMIVDLLIALGGVRQKEGIVSS